MDLQEYRIERLEKSRFGDMTALHKAVYGKAKDENYFPRKYDTAYTGNENLGYLAYKDSVAVAFYGVIPCFIEFEGKITATAQSADTMTHPGHRNKGLFAKLARLTYALCKESGIKLVFGFPNQNSHHGFSNTLQWTETQSLSSFTIPLKRGFIPLAFKRFPLTRSFYQGYAQSIIRKYQTGEAGIPNSIVKNGYGGIYRDEAYLQYKNYHDRVVMKIGEAKVWASIKDSLLIGDLENVANNKDLIKTIEGLKALGQRLGLTSINFQVSPDTTLHRLFSENYKPVDSFSTMFLDLGANLPLEQIKFTFADIDIY